MIERYEVSRSHTDKELHVICRDGRFYDDVPPSIRHLGPWTAGGRGAISALKPIYRAMLAAHGFVVVHQHLKDFRPEN